MTTNQPKFSKRHYQAIAQALRLCDTHKLIESNAVTELSVLFVEDNPKFDAEKFNTAIFHKKEATQ